MGFKCVIVGWPNVGKYPTKAGIEAAPTFHSAQSLSEHSVRPYVRTSFDQLAEIVNQQRAASHADHGNLSRSPVWCSAAHRKAKRP